MKEKLTELKLIDVLKTLNGSPAVNREMVTAVGVVYLNENTGMSNLLLTGIDKESFFDLCDSLRGYVDSDGVKPEIFSGVAIIDRLEDNAQSAMQPTGGDNDKP